MSHILELQNRLIEEFFSPVKPSQMVLPDRTATKENPTKLTRREVVTKEFNAWYDPDGSYHEVLIEDNGDLPTRPEITD